MASARVRRLSKDLHRQRVHARVRTKVEGTPERPRLSVYRSLGHIYAQVIDDRSGKTLISASSVDGETKKNLIKLNMKGSTIPHQVLGRYGSAQVLLKPASEGTGVIAGGPVRKVMQVAGITNVLTKSIGTSNPHNVVKATFAALLGLKDIAHVAETRSKTVEEISGKPPKEKAAASEGA